MQPCAEQDHACADNLQVFLWRVPEGFSLRTDAEEVTDIAPVGKLSGHPR